MGVSYVIACYIQSENIHRNVCKVAYIFHPYHQRFVGNSHFVYFHVESGHRELFIGIAKDVATLPVAPFGEGIIDIID